MNTQYQKTIKRISFRAIPIHPDRYREELFYYEKLKVLGLKIEPPVLASPEYFCEDKIHLKKEFRNYTSYTILMGK